MSALLTDRRVPAPRRQREGDCRPRAERSPTLDDVVSRTWEVLRAGVPAACLVCGHELTPRGAAAAPATAGARCDGCGATLG